MSGFAASLLAPVVEAGVKYVVAEIKRQFIYLCCFVSNITALKEEAKNLDDAIQGVQAQVDAAKNNGHDIHPHVTSWSGESDNLKNEMNRILNEVPNVESGCSTLIERFSLSKRAKKTSEAMSQHRQNSNFNTISLPPPAAATKEIPLGTTYAFDSRNKIEQEVVIALGDNGDNSMIGIHGMGGLGKTTMAKRIMNTLLKEKVFEEVVMAVVSHQVDELKIQLEIGLSLGLKGLEKEAPLARVQKIHDRLTQDTKRTLIVLDDVWEKLVLEKLGIPRGCKGCTILMTSRNEDVLRATDVKKVFEMKILSEEDAWFMFREKVGTCVDDRRLNSTAKQVVRECRGLPIALEAIGAALKDEKTKSVWNDTLKKIRKPNPKTIPRFIADVYKPLIISYDKLDNEEIQSLFLLCCLFPEDDNISVEHLTYFCTGLRIFEDVWSLEDARDRMCTLIKSLKSRSLLLDGSDEDHVRMHDVIRDVCIFIAKQKGYINDGNGGAWMSSCHLSGGAGIVQLPFPNLHVLFLSKIFSEEGGELQIENTFFERERELYVLSIHRYSWRSLPQSLNNLRTLVIDSCYDLETIYVVGGLVNLEILSCLDCDSIETLPEEIGGLKHLKVLQLTGCGNLQFIAPGIISSLVELEELKMLRSFNNWEINRGELVDTPTARLRELEALKKLRCLEIEIRDPRLAAQQFTLSSNLQRFHIIIDSYNFRDFPKGSNKIMNLRWEEGTCLGRWMEKLLQDTECLYLSGSGAENLDHVTNNIRWLILERCESMKSIVTTSILDGDAMECLALSHLPQLHHIWSTPLPSNSFHNLNKIYLANLPALKQLWPINIDGGGAPMLPRMECLQLEDLPQLQEIWNAPISSNSFQNLKKIDLRRLPALKQLWKSNASLPQLQSLEIIKCEMMEHVFLSSVDDEDQNNSSRNIAAIQAIQFPLLTAIRISECPNFRGIIPTASLNGYADIDDHSSHLFCRPQQVSFGKLKDLDFNVRNPFCHHNNIHVSFFNELETLSICKYEGNMSLFTPSIATSLVNLRKLCINDCHEIVQVIEEDEEEGDVYIAVSGGGGRRRLFPKLRTLELKNLSKLVAFCKFKCDVELPSLKDVSIYECRSMTNSTLATLDLEAFKTDLHYYLLKVPFNLDQIPFAFSFNGLQELLIQNYEGSVGIFSSSIAENLINLKQLCIDHCTEMVKVIEIEEEERVPSEGQMATTLIFPKMQHLQLNCLTSLEIFCQYKRDVKLPLLEELTIMSCPNITAFTLGSIITPNLKFAKINWIKYSIDASTHLNGVLQQHFDQEKERRMNMEDRRMRIKKRREDRKKQREDEESTSIN